MVIIALIVASIALVLSLVVALASLELVANSNPSAAAAQKVEPVDVGDGVLGARPSDYGLPERLDRLRSGIILFISPKCKMCNEIAAGFEGKIPDAITVVVTAAEPERLRAWSTERGLPADELIFDDGYEIVDSLGVTASPVGIGLAEGAMAFAVGIPHIAGLNEVLTDQAEYASGFTPKEMAKTPTGLQKGDLR